jgi:hypothetical protein
VNDRNSVPPSFTEVAEKTDYQKQKSPCLFSASLGVFGVIRRKAPQLKTSEVRGNLDNSDCSGWVVLKRCGGCRFLHNEVNKNPCSGMGLQRAVLGTVGTA